MALVEAEMAENWEVVQSWMLKAEACRVVGRERHHEEWVDITMFLEISEISLARLLVKSLSSSWPNDRFIS